MNILSKTYRTWMCHWCRRHLKNGEKIYYVISLQGMNFCEDCKRLLENPPEFSPEGSKEKGTTSWVTARNLALLRDSCHCRVCDEPFKIEVHHIIPKKDGGTNNLKNLITLCQRHHKETFANNYAGLRLTDRFIKLGVQHQLV